MLHLLNAPGPWCLGTNIFSNSINFFHDYCLVYVSPFHNLVIPISPGNYPFQDLKCILIELHNFLKFSFSFTIFCFLWFFIKVANELSSLLAFPLKESFHGPIFLY